MHAVNYGEVILIKGRVLKILSDRFVVDNGSEAVFAKARKKLKECNLLAGDIAELEFVSGEYVLAGIQPRIRRLIRPAIANPDQIVITVAEIPEVEFYTLDKMVINAHKVGVRTLICINKTDLATASFLDGIKKQYEGVVDKIVEVSALNSDISPLLSELKGKFSLFAGQSAVGKTSLINVVCGLSRQVGELSEKTMRGKNTTTGVELIKIDPQTYVADTPGFATLDLDEIEGEELALYYDEYVRLADGCKYRMCTHTIEPNCAVRNAVEDGRLSSERYERYKNMLEELKINKTRRKSWRKTYESK